MTTWSSPENLITWESSDELVLEKMCKLLHAHLSESMQLPYTDGLFCYTVDMKAKSEEPFTDNHTHDTPVSGESYRPYARINKQITIQQICGK